MYGLPTDFDSNFLIGRKLELISFSENTLSIVFDAEVSITVLASIKYNEDVFDIPIKRSSLMSLLGNMY